ncbi:MAG: hypothetical protein Kow0068_14380 [Marinilabiliales bacterium]
MPYRRLPNTNTARYKALKTALDKGASLPPFQLPFKQESLLQLKSFFPEYDRSYRQLKEAHKTLSEYNKKYHEMRNKAKLYISHFFQVFNMAIARGEISPKSREFFGLSENNKKTPPLTSEKQIIKWGEQIIKGEPERIAAGGNPVTNPTIAVVRVHYDHFIDAYRQLSTYKEHYQRANEKIKKLIPIADEIILRIWNETESFFSNLPDDEKRKKTSEFGIVYFFRKNESKENKKNKGDINKPDLQYSLLLFTN